MGQHHWRSEADLGLDKDLVEECYAYVSKISSRFIKKRNAFLYSLKHFNRRLHGEFGL